MFGILLHKYRDSDGHYKHCPISFERQIYLAETTRRWKIPTKKPHSIYRHWELPTWKTWPHYAPRECELSNKPHWKTWSAGILDGPCWVGRLKVRQPPQKRWAETTVCNCYPQTPTKVLGYPVRVAPSSVDGWWWQWVVMWSLWSMCLGGR